MDQLLWDAEEVVLCHDRRTGLRAVIAVDDTTLGPGLGGVRWKRYPTAGAAILEARRLAAAMTLKNAVAEIPFGGAKSVLLYEGAPRDRAVLMRAFGGFVSRLGGRYIPGVDMGTTVGDLAEMAKVAPDVACDEADPSPWTALGVFAAIRAAVAHEGSDLAGVRVVVQGAGSVGAELVRLLREAGAAVTLTDADAQRAAAVAVAHGAEVVAPDAVLDVACDVFAPCAIARVLDAETSVRLRCRIVCGAANDTLSDPAIAAQLARAGIVYVPDFVANAGGVIHIQALRAAWDEDRLRATVLRIGDRVDDLLRANDTPLDAAHAMALARLACG